MALVKLIPSHAFLFKWISGCFSAHSRDPSNEVLSCITCQEKFLATSSQGKLGLGIVANWMEHCPSSADQGRVPLTVDTEEVIVWMAPIGSLSPCTFIIWQ